MLRRYRTDSGTCMQMDLSALMSLRFDGDLEVFLDKFDTFLLESSSTIPEEMLRAVLTPQLRKSKDLVPDFV